MTPDSMMEVVARTLKGTLKSDERIIETRKIKGGKLNLAYKTQISTSKGIRSMISKFYLDLDKVELPEIYQEWLKLTTAPREGSRRAQNVFFTLTDLFKKGVRVPRPVIINEEHSMVIEEFVEGASIQDLIGRNRETDEKIMRMLASWFVSLHRSYPPKKEIAFPKLDHIYTTLDFCAKTTANKALIEKLRSLLRSSRTKFTNTCVMLKSDSSIKHFILSNGRLFAFDFEFCGFGDPANDISEVCASILMKNPKSISENNLRLCNVLVQEYLKKGFKIGGRLPTLVAASLIIHAFWTPLRRRTLLKWAQEILLRKFDHVLSP